MLAIDASASEATRSRRAPASSVVLVTSREPVDDLYHSLKERSQIQRIGDCLAPGTIATAVYSGHRYAREADVESPSGVPFWRE